MNNLYYSPVSKSSPPLVPCLCLYDVAEIHLLGENVGLCSGVGDVSLGVELLCNAHCCLSAELEFPRSLLLKLDCVQWKRSPLVLWFIPENSLNAETNFGITYNNLPAVLHPCSTVFSANIKIH